MVKSKKVLNHCTLLSILYVLFIYLCYLHRLLTSFLICLSTYHLFFSLFLLYLSYFHPLLISLSICCSTYHLLLHSLSIVSIFIISLLPLCSQSLPIISMRPLSIFSILVLSALLSLSVSLYFMYLSLYPLLILQ